MKRITLISILFLLFFTTQAQKNVIGLGVNAIKLVPRISYERKISSKITAVIGIEKGKYDSDYGNSFSNDREFSNLKGFGIEPEFRVYPFAKYKSAPLGVFVGAHYRYRWLTEQYNGYYPFTADAKAYNYGINVGYKLHVDFLTFEFLFGVGKSGGKWDSSEVENHDFEGKDLTSKNNHTRLEVTVGFHFPYKSY